MFANVLPLGEVGAKQAKLLTTKTIITDEKKIIKFKTMPNRSKWLLGNRLFFTQY